MQDLSYRFTAILRKSSGEGAWFFITVPVDHTGEIKFFAPDAKQGFGSVRVTATIAGFAWKTSVFPSKEAGAYLLPVKAEIRKKTSLGDGDQVDVKLDIVV